MIVVTRVAQQIEFLTALPLHFTLPLKQVNKYFKNYFLIIPFYIGFLLIMASWWRKKYYKSCRMLLSINIQL